MRWRLFVSLLTLVALPGLAAAQSNLAVVGGAMFPVSNFSNSTGISPYVGGRYEIQDVNALGQKQVFTFLAYGGYGFLLADSDYKKVLEAAGEDTDGSFFDIGVGARAYSRASGLFAGVGAAYANVGYPGPGGSRDALEVQVGLGAVAKRTSYVVEIEARGNFLFVDNSDNIGHFLILLGLGFPVGG